MFLSLFKIHLLIFEEKKINFILGNFLVPTLQYFQKKIPMNTYMKKTLSKVGHNRPKSSPNLNFCSIKIAHRVPYV